MSKKILIGEILENGEIEKGQSAQGLIYKNSEAFNNKKDVCYVPELNNTKYTYDDFISIANGNEDIAKELFNCVDWQSPETLMEEWFNSDEVYTCDKCKKTYFSYDIDNCPFCAHEKDI